MPSRISAPIGSRSAAGGGGGSGRRIPPRNAAETMNEQASTAIAIGAVSSFTRNPAAPNARNSIALEVAARAPFARTSSARATMVGRYALSATSKKVVSTAASDDTSSTWASVSQPPTAATGMEPSRTARPRSAQIITGRRRSRSTHAPATNPTSRAATRSTARSAAISMGPARRVSIATNGSAMRVTNEPKTETVAALHRSMNARLRRSPGRGAPRAWAGPDRAAGRGSPAEPTRHGTFGRGRPREAWRTLRTPRCRQNPRTTRPASAVRPDPHHQSQGSPPPHVRHPQRPPPQDPRRVDRSWPRDRSGPRCGDARGPARPARGGRQLQGGQGLRRAGARAGAGRRDPREPHRRPAGRQDRQRGAHRAPVRGRPDLPPRGQPGRDRPRRPPGIGQDDVRGQARQAHRQARSGAAPRGRRPLPAGRRGPARDAGQEPQHRRLSRPGRDPDRGHRPAGHRAREAHRPRHRDHRHRGPPHHRRRAHGGDPRGRRRDAGPSRRCSSWTR